MSDIDGLDAVLKTRRAAHDGRTFIVGVTGGVAAGKSTLGMELCHRLKTWPGSPDVELASTDGFLRDNAWLSSRGLTLRKGYPETYDAEALTAALHDVREGSAVFPGYSHYTYDVDPAASRTLQRPDILIVEGLGLAGALVDVLIYIDAEEVDLEAWFVSRFLAFWTAGRSDPHSFYSEFAKLTPEEADAFGHRVWREINLPNVRANITPLREAADIVVRKRTNHGIESVTERR